MRLRFSCFWYWYFLIRIAYLFFSVLVYGKLSTLGDTSRYLSAEVHFQLISLYNSTSLMDFVGGVCGTLLGGNTILSNFPFMLLSYYFIWWSIEELGLRRKLNNGLLLLIISLPNLCIWTSVCSKETFGLIISSVLGVLFVHFFNGDFRMRLRDYFALYLCIIFKPQYLPFILQGLFLIYLMNRCVCSLKGRFLLTLFCVSSNMLFLYVIKDLINQYAGIMYLHFALDSAESTRENIWVEENDFFWKAPWGMFVAFFGPTLNEMVQKPLQLIAGLESTLILILLLHLSVKMVYRLLACGKIHSVLVPTLFIVVTGICLLHYPFGIFNPGSAIRYRTNFLYLFILLFCQVYVTYKELNHTHHPKIS